jgi:hypothetical protein
VSKGNSAAGQTEPQPKVTIFAGDLLALDRELGRGDRQAKPARARASRVDVEDAVALLHRRAVRMPRDDDAHAGGARLDVDLREIVDRVDEDLAEADQLALAQALCPRAASLLPRTAVSGATARSASSTDGSQTSPPWTMWSLPRRKSSTSGRSRPVRVRDQADPHAPSGKRSEVVREVFAIALPAARLVGRLRRRVCDVGVQADADGAVRARMVGRGRSSDEPTPLRRWLGATNRSLRMKTRAIDTDEKLG